MRRAALLISLAAFVLWAGASAPAQQASTTAFVSAFESEELTVDSTAGGVRFTTSKTTVWTPAFHRAQQATFRVVCATSSPCSLRFTLDNSTVTTTHGFLLNEGDIVTLFNYVNIDQARFIRTGANSAVLAVHFFD